MKGDDWMGILVIVGIIGIALFGGAKGSGNGGMFSFSQPNPASSPAEIQNKINQTEYEVQELQKQVQAEEDKKNNSKFFGMMELRYINRATDPKLEYVNIQASYDLAEPILITGWTLKSISSGNVVTIPKGVYLYFSGMANYADNIYIEKNQTIYLVTGSSPVGENFKTNKCSGFLNQFQTFAPYLYSNCPLPRNENLSSIPKTVVNDACLEYIDRFPMCRIQTDPLPANWSYECNNFIYQKINYSACVNTHKGDKDFYGNEWRLYLKRSESIWKSSREEVVLLDEFGKVVSRLKY